MADRSPEELAELLTLSEVPGVGIAKFAALLRHFGSARAALHADRAALESVAGITPTISALIPEAKPSEAVLRQCELLVSSNVSVLVCSDPDYPQHLAALDDAPPILFVKGNAGLLALPGIAVVGTRRPSEYGRHVTAEIVRSLIEHGETIISGMARGVDGLAHKVALNRGGMTVAVLGCGVDQVYPPEARPMHARIAEEGALVSELWLGTPPDRINFPRRNRIISGLSRAVIITEAPSGSGALITAETAARQGREVYAVPGDVTRRQSEGVNRLIADGAQIVTGLNDLLVNLGLAVKVATAAGDRIGLPVGPPSDLTDEERRILDALAIDPLHIDALALKLGSDPSELLTHLTIMEVRGLVASHPGSCYARAIIAS